ncbi:MAG: hypothetical protein ACRD12_16650, partial [Acidimicrobiales bacterium]
MADAEDQRCAVATIAIADYDDDRVPATPVHDAGVAFASLFGGAGGLVHNIARNHRLGPRAEEAAVRGAVAAWGAAGAEVG